MKVLETLACRTRKNCIVIGVVNSVPVLSYNSEKKYFAIKRKCHNKGTSRGGRAAISRWNKCPTNGNYEQAKRAFCKVIDKHQLSPP